jgi:hypothetical protein
VALAARKTQGSGSVDRQTKIDGDANIMRVHKLLNTNDALTATLSLNTTIKHFDCNKAPANIFSVQRYLMDREC